MSEVTALVITLTEAIIRVTDPKLIVSTIQAESISRNTTGALITNTTKAGDISPNLALLEFTKMVILADGTLRNTTAASATITAQALGTSGDSTLAHSVRGSRYYGTLGE